MTSAKGLPTDARLRFAGDIAAAAIFRGLPDQKNLMRQSRYLFEMLWLRVTDTPLALYKC